MSSHAQSPTVLFLHIPKTAGTTLHFISKRQYEDDEFYELHHEPEIYQLTAAQKQAIRFFKGPYWYGLHDQFERPTTYVTILRDPLKRIVSLYNYVRQTPGHGMYEVANRYSLAELYTHHLHKEALDNGQTRRISGVWDEVPYGGVDEAIFEQAKEHLTNQFSVVGITKRFDETLLLLADELDWADVTYRKQNTAKSATRPDELLDPHTRELIMRHNVWDQRLYNYAGQLLDDAIQAKGVDFRRRVWMFRLRNKSKLWWERYYWQGIRTWTVRTWIREWWQGQRPS